MKSRSSTFKFTAIQIPDHWSSHPRHSRHWTLLPRCLEVELKHERLSVVAEGWVLWRPKFVRPESHPELMSTRTPGMIFESAPCWCFSTPQPPIGRPAILMAAVSFLLASDLQPWNPKTRAMPRRNSGMQPWMVCSRTHLEPGECQYSHLKIKRLRQTICRIT